MTRKAIVIPATNDYAAHPESWASISAAGQRWGAEVILDQTPVEGIVHRLEIKLHIARRYIDQYDQLLQLDGDVLIREDAPSIFDRVSVERIGLVTIMQATSKTVGRVIDWAQRFAAATGHRMPSPFKMCNSGVMLYSPAVAEERLFAPARAIVAGLSEEWRRQWLVEQTSLGFVAAGEPAVEWIGADYNRVLLEFPDPAPLPAWIGHFCGGNARSKFVRISRAKWRTPDGAGLSAPHVRSRTNRMKQARRASGVQETTYLSRAIIVPIIRGYQLVGKSRESIAAAGERWSAQVMFDATPADRIVHKLETKLNIARRYADEFDQLLQLDADVLIREDAPNIFERVPAGFGAVTLAQASNHSWRRVHRWACRFAAVVGCPAPSPHDLLNSGVLVYCPAQAEAAIFSEARALLACAPPRMRRHWLAEQTALSLAAAACPSVEWIETDFNRLLPTYQRPGRLPAWIGHFHAGSEGSKRARIRRAWWRSSRKTPPLASKARSAPT